MSASRNAVFSKRRFSAWSCFWPNRFVVGTSACLLAYSFFKFGWSYRLFNYCSILIGAVPLVRDEATHSAETEAAILRAAKMNILAGKHFNAGLRGIFFSISYLGWFVNAGVFAVTTFILLGVLIRRQFFSSARAALLVQLPPQAGPGSTESIRPVNQ